MSVKRNSAPASFDLEIDHLAPARIGAQVADERGIAAELGSHAEVADLAVAPRHPQFEAAQRLAIVACDGAELDVEIEVAARLLALFRPRTGCRGLDEAAAVEDVAAHRDFQRAVRRAVGAQRRLVAVGQRERREARKRYLAVLRRARPCPSRACPAPRSRCRRNASTCGLSITVKVTRAALAGGLPPARQQFGDLAVLQVGLDLVAALARRWSATRPVQS